jgi:predicted house-cleaning noncanonical NTP pyrophosphatase (MazG superfamily)
MSRCFVNIFEIIFQRAISYRFTQKNEFLAEVYRKLEEAEESVKNGEVYDAWEMLEKIKKRYNF